jgi:predicted HicB family RNase H-like nuclease
MGERGPKPQAKHKTRGKLLRVRVKPAELRRLKTNADAAGMSVPNYVRVRLGLERVARDDDE